MTPNTYPATLADLILMADAVGELDSLRYLLPYDAAAENSRIEALVTRAYDTIERIAAGDAEAIFGPPEEATT